MNLKNKLTKLYNEAQANIFVWEKKIPNSKNIVEIILNYKMAEYWRGRRDAYFLLLKGRDEK